MVKFGFGHFISSVMVTKSWKKMKYVIVISIFMVFLDVSNSQDEPDETNNPCKVNPCGNGICNLDLENR